MADEEYKVDYSDKRFTQVDKEKKSAIKESNSTYDSMLKESDGYYNEQIDAVRDYGDEQKKNQQALTDQAIAEIEQNKEKVYKDYVDEQSGAYTDWQKQSNQYGANAEQQASIGVGNSGYSESSQVAMYNQYQNRVTAARESYLTAVQNYDNSITEARLKNNSLLAEIAYNTLKTSLELSLNGFQYKNTLLLEKVNAKQNLENIYYQRHQDVLAQINTEKATAEQIRQYNESLALEKAKQEEQIRQYNESLAFEREKLAEQQRQFDESMAASSYSGSGGSGSYSSYSGYSSGYSSYGGYSDYYDDYDYGYGYGGSDDYGYIPEDDDIGGGPGGGGKGGKEVSNQTKLDIGSGPVSDDWIKKGVQSGDLKVNDDGSISKKPEALKYDGNEAWKNLFGF